MIATLVTIVLVLGAIVLALGFLLGFRLGGDSSHAELRRVRAESADARREMHDLTRAAFVAMVDRAQEQDRPPL